MGQQTGPDERRMLADLIRTALHEAQQRGLVETAAHLEAALEAAVRLADTQPALGPARKKGDC